MLTSVSVFAGIGGVDHGFEKAGIRTVAQVEKDKNCLNVLRRHFPHAPKITDVNHADRTNIPTHHILAGGFPCQGASVAGEGKGLADDRTGLWFKLHGLAMEFCPGVVVIENVPGLLSCTERRDFALVLGGLLGFPVGVPEQWRTGGIARGRIYNVAWRVLDSRFFGVAQRRRRVFIVACHRSLGVSPFEILFDEESLHRDCEAGGEAGEETASAPDSGVRGSGGIDGGGDEVAGCRGNPRRKDLDGHGAYIAGTLKTDMRRGSDQNAASGLLLADPLNASTAKRGVPSDSFPLVTPAVTSKWSNASCSVTEQPGITAALRANAEHSNQFLMDRTGVRRLTPLECERLQGFPDGYTAEGVTESGKVVKIKDAPRYHMLGNAVTTTVAEWLGRRIVAIAGARLLEWKR